MLKKEAGWSSETSVKSTKLYGVTFQTVLLFTYTESQYCALFGTAHWHELTVKLKFTKLGNNKFHYYSSRQAVVSVSGGLASVCRCTLLRIFCRVHCVYMFWKLAQCLRTVTLVPGQITVSNRGYIVKTISCHHNYHLVKHFPEWRNPANLTDANYVHIDLDRIQDDSKLLPRFPFISHENPRNNLESPCNLDYLNSTASDNPSSYSSLYFISYIGH